MAGAETEVAVALRRLVVVPVRRTGVPRVAREAPAPVDPVGAADPLEFSVFDHPEDGLLHAHRNGAEFVQQQGSAVRPFEASDVASRSAGEGAGLVAEELGLEEAFGERSAVDLDEGLLPAAREKMQTGRNQFLAGAALAQDQDRPVEGRRSGDLFKD